MKSSNDMQALTRDAEDALQAGDRDLAATCYEKVLSLDADYAPAYANLGLIQFELGNVERAESLFLAGIEKDYDLREAHFNLGCLYQSIEEHESALECFRTVIEKDTDDYEAYYRMGLSCIAMKRCEDAKGFLQTAFQLKPDCLEFGLALARYFFYHHIYDKAESVLRLLLVTHNKTPQLYYLLGLSLKEQGKTESALAQFFRTVACDENNSMAYFFLGKCCHDLALHKQAKDFFMRARDLNAGLTDEIRFYFPDEQENG